MDESLLLLQGENSLLRRLLIKNRDVHGRKFYWERCRTAQKRLEAVLTVDWGWVTAVLAAGEARAPDFALSAARGAARLLRGAIVAGEAAVNAVVPILQRGHWPQLTAALLAIFARILHLLPNLLLRSLRTTAVQLQDDEEDLGTALGGCCAATPD